jgi:hypothetical protein
LVESNNEAKTASLYTEPKIVSNEKSEGKREEKGDATLF